MLVVGVAEEREARQDSKPLFPEGAEGFSLGKDGCPAISVQSFYSNNSTRLLGLGKIPATNVILSLLPVRIDSPQKSQSLLTMASCNQN